MQIKQSSGDESTKYEDFTLVIFKAVLKMQRVINLKPNIFTALLGMIKHTKKEKPLKISVEQHAFLMHRFCSALKVEVHFVLDFWKL